MLTWMRTHQKTIMTWTLYLVIPSFVLLYGYGRIQRRPEDRWVVKVADQPIRYNEMTRMEENLRERYQRQYGDRFDEVMEGRDLRQEALDSLIKQQIILNAAKQFGFDVSNKELVEYIVSSGAFQDENGQFDIRRFQNYLYQTRTPEEYFDETVRKGILRSKVATFIRSTMLRSAAETEKDFQRRNEQVTAEMLAFRPDEYTDEVTVEEKGLQDFFEERQENYRIPEQRRIQYVEYLAKNYQDQVEVSEGRLKAFFSRNQKKYTIGETRKAEWILYAASDYLDQVSLSDEEVRSYFKKNSTRYRTKRRIQIRFISSPVEEWTQKVQVTPEEIENWYETNKKRYTHEEEVHARHILLKVPSDATPEVETQVSNRIKKIRKEILDGLDFTEAARKYSEDTGSAQKGGDLGFFSRKRMVAPFSNAAFSLPVGEISEPVRTRYGFHLIQVEEKRDAFVEPLTDVRDEVEKIIRQRKARELFQKFADSVKSLDDIASEYKIHTSKWFTRDDSIEGVDPTDLTLVYFTAARRRKAQRPEPAFGTKTYYLLELTGDEQSRPKTFEEARGKVVIDARKDLANRQALMAAQSDLGRIVAGQITWEQLLKSRKTKATETKPFPQSGGYIEGLGSGSRAFANAAFGLEKVGDVGGPTQSDRGAYLLRLTAIQEAHLPELSEVRDKVKNDFIIAESGKLAYNEAAKLADEAFNTEKPLDECAQKMGLQIRESQFFKAGGTIPPIGFQRDVNERAFKIKKTGTVSDVIAVHAQTSPQKPQDSNGPVERCYVISLLEIKDTYLPELDEVRDDVEKDYKLFLAAGVAKEKADAALALIQEKIAAGTPVSPTRTVDFEALASAGEHGKAAVDGTYIRPTKINQASSYVQGVGSSTDLRKTAFALKPGQISRVIEVRETKYSPKGEEQIGDVTGYYIIQVIGHEEAGTLTLDQRQQQMETMWEQRAQSMAFNAWIDSVSHESKIEYNTEVLSPAGIPKEATQENSAT